ncbi:hypothetical protein N7540_006452 [Penicillium herquei]|nr:hypothetical protein N7540_006452 [Penicillium herquei]
MTSEVASLLQVSKFADLPVDLLFCIRDYLSPVDITCLSLCTRGLMSFLSPGSPGALKDRIPRAQPGDMTSERFIFLDLLSKDLPQYYLCHSCMQLHLWSNVNMPGMTEYRNQTENGIPLSCIMKLRSNSNWTEFYWLSLAMQEECYVSHNHYSFYFVHLYLMMRRFRYGPTYGLSPDAAFFAEVNVQPLQHFPGRFFASLLPTLNDQTFFNSYLTHIFSVEARVNPINPSLCLRFQDTGLVSREFALMLIPKDADDHFSPCGHRKNKSPEPFRSLMEAYSANGDLGISRGKCTDCSMEYEIQVREADTNDVTLTITRWIDLGPGLSPDDPQWRTHHQFYAEPVPPSDLVPDPRRRFERAPSTQGGSNVSIEERYRRNMSFLEAERYKTMMTQVEDSGNIPWDTISWVTHRDFQVDT